MIIGGLVVSAFALLGDLLKPKSFAGLFGAAPAVAIATLALTAMKSGKEYAGIEARSMILGGLAFCFYAYVVGRLLIRRHLPVLSTASFAIALWLCGAFGLWYAVLR